MSGPVFSSLTDNGIERVVKIDAGEMCLDRCMRVVSKDVVETGEEVDTAYGKGYCLPSKCLPNGLETIGGRNTAISIKQARESSTQN